MEKFVRPDPPVAVLTTAPSTPAPRRKRGRRELVEAMERSQAAIQDEAIDILASLETQLEALRRYDSATETHAVEMRKGFKALQRQAAGYTAKESEADSDEHTARQAIDAWLRGNKYGPATSRAEFHVLSVRTRLRLLCILIESLQHEIRQFRMANRAEVPDSGVAYSSLQNKPERR
jgi:hypothetical protein